MSSPLSGFTAVPNPQMLAFMGAQSFIMMFQAGEGWQYGKRRISAMSNEDFNKLTPERLLQNQAATLRSSLGTIEKSMNDMTPMIATIIHQYGEFLKVVIRETPSVFLGVTGGKTPEQIVHDFGLQMQKEGKTDLTTQKDVSNVLLDFFKSLLDPLPEAGGSSEVVSTSTGATITHVVDKPGSKIHGPGIQTVKEPFISKQAQAIIDAKSATFKESFSQQVGSTGQMSFGKKNAIRELTRLQGLRDEIIKANKKALQNNWLRTTSGWNQYNSNKVLISDYNKRIAFQKVAIGRFKF